MSNVNHWQMMARGLSPLQMAQLTKKKRCGECGQLKPTDRFTSDRRIPDQLSPTCNDCKPDNTAEKKRKQQEYARRYYAENRERIREKNIAYGRKNRKILSAKQKQWRKNNPEKTKEYRKKDAIRAKNNREKNNARHRRWAAQNPEKIKKYNERRRQNRTLLKPRQHENPQYQQNNAHVDHDQTAHF